MYDCIWYTWLYLTGKGVSISSRPSLYDASCMYGVCITGRGAYCSAATDTVGQVPRQHLGRHDNTHTHTHTHTRTPTQTHTHAHTRTHTPLPVRYVTYTHSASHREGCVIHIMQHAHTDLARHRRQREKLGERCVFVRNGTCYRTSRRCKRLTMQTTEPASERIRRWCMVNHSQSAGLQPSQLADQPSRCRCRWIPAILSAFWLSSSNSLYRLPHQHHTLPVRYKIRHTHAVRTTVQGNARSLARKPTNKPARSLTSRTAVAPAHRSPP